jgi:hypothetical protein
MMLAQLAEREKKKKYLEEVCCLEQERRQQTRSQNYAEETLRGGLARAEK